MPLAIYNYKPLCSFKKSPSCSRDQKLGIFQQIELYDGSRIVVPELHLTTREFFNSEDYYCCNFDGQLVSLPIPVNTPITGSSAFCRHHQCSPSTLKSVFCIYFSPTTTFDLGNFSIIIRAWRATSKEYYAFKEYIEDTLDSHSTPRCLKGGIEIETTKTFDILEVCSSSICIYVNNYKSGTTIFFPTSIVIFEYTASVMGWINSERILSSNVTCPGQPLCETLRCRLCWEKAYNFQCWTITEIAVSLILLVTIALFIHIAIPVFTAIVWIVKRLLHLSLLLFRAVLSRCKKLFGSHRSYNVETSSHQSRTR